MNKKDMIIDLVLIGMLLFAGIWTITERQKTVDECTQSCKQQLGTTCEAWQKYCFRPTNTDINGGLKICT